MLGHVNDRCDREGGDVEATESWQAMKRALAGKPPNRGRVLRLEDKGPGSKDAIVRYVRMAIEQHTMPKQDANPQHLAEMITTSVLNRLGAGFAAPRC
jgi:hypothetical protein